MPTIVELRQRRASLWEEAKGIMNRAEKTSGKMGTEDKQQWDRINDDIDTLKDQIDWQVRAEQVESGLAEVDEPTVARRAMPAAPVSLEDEDDEPLSTLPDDKVYSRSFMAYVRHGLSGMKLEHRAVLQPFFGAIEGRALGTTSASVGGATVPAEFYRRLVESMVTFGGMRQANTTKISTASGATMPIPTVDDSANSGAILAENTQITEQDVAFAVVNLGAYMYTSKLVRVSLQLIQDTAFPIDTWLPEVLGRRLGRITNEHFTNGTGTGQPRGILAASGGATLGAAGAAGSTTTITFVKLVELEHSVDPAYRRNGAQWMFSDIALRGLKSMVDGQSRPLWLPGLAVNAPDTIMGYPYVINQSVPVMAASAKSMLFGDFSYYYIRDVMDLRVMRLEERYADFLQVGFFGFLRTDGVFANPDAGAANSPVKYYQNAAT